VTTRPGRLVWWTRPGPGRARPAGAALSRRGDGPDRSVTRLVRPGRFARPTRSVTATPVVRHGSAGAARPGPGRVHRTARRPRRTTPTRSIARPGRVGRVCLLAMLGHLHVGRLVRRVRHRGRRPRRAGRVWRRRRRRRWLPRRVWRPVRRDRRRRRRRRWVTLWWARRRRQHWRARTRRGYARRRRRRVAARRVHRDRRSRRVRPVSFRVRPPRWRARPGPAGSVRTTHPWPTELRRLIGLFVRRGRRTGAERVGRRLGRAVDPAGLFHGGYTSLGTYPRRRGGALVRVPALARPGRTHALTRRWFARAVRTGPGRTWSDRVVAEAVRPGRVRQYRSDYVVAVVAGRALL
jgi:hypothetical protein